MLNGSRKMPPCRVLVWGWQAAQKLCETKKSNHVSRPSKSYDYVSLANYNDRARHEWCELNSPSLCTVHLFRFMGGDGMAWDGGETKQRTVCVKFSCCACSPCFSVNSVHVEWINQPWWARIYIGLVSWPIWARPLLSGHIKLQKC